MAFVPSHVHRSLEMVDCRPSLESADGRAAATCSPRSGFSFSSLCDQGTSSPRAVLQSQHDVVQVALNTLGVHDPMQRSRRGSRTAFRAPTADRCTSKKVAQNVHRANTLRAHKQDTPVIQSKLRESSSLGPRCALQAHPEDCSMFQEVDKSCQSGPNLQASRLKLEDQAPLQKGYENCQYVPMHVEQTRCADHSTLHCKGKTCRAGSKSAVSQSESTKLAMLRDSCLRVVNLVRAHSADGSTFKKVAEKRRCGSKSKNLQAKAAAHSIENSPPCSLGSNTCSPKSANLVRDRSAKECQKNEGVEYLEYAASAELSRLQASRAAATALLCQKEVQPFSLGTGHVTLRQRKQSLLCHSGSLTARARTLIRPPIDQVGAADKDSIVTAVDEDERDSIHNLDRCVAQLVTAPPDQTSSATKERKVTNRRLKYAMSLTVLGA